MTEHSFDYMADFKPEKHCSQWAMTDSTLGRLFTRLIPFQKAKHPTKPRTWYHCQCACGGYAFASKSQLHDQKKKSCGCLRADAAIRIGYAARAKSMEGHIAGTKFNRLTLEAFHGIGNYGPEYMWACDCGGSKIVAFVHAKNGHVKSCGCLQKENAAGVLSSFVHGILPPTNLKHGASRGGKRDLTYSSWSSMKTRCTNPSTQNWPRYGGRGITICDEWVNDYEAFLRDMGRRPSKEMTLDRIDVNGNYEPSNCRWATASQQILNRRSTAPRLRGVDGRFLNKMEQQHG